MRRALVGLLAVSVAALLPALAAGAPEASHSESKLETAAEEPVQAGAPEPSAMQSDTGSTTPPFNGVDALALSAVALSLLAAGFTLRRLSGRAQ